MSKSIENRLEKIEQKLSMDKDTDKIPLVILHFDRCGDDEPLLDSLEPIENWESEKQVLAQHKGEGVIVFHFDPLLELEARKRPLTQDELATLTG